MAVFPSKVGGYSYSNRLSKPLDRVRRELGIPHRLTSKVMRRTFNNLLRRKAVDRLVLRSLTGHSVLPLVSQGPCAKPGQLQPQPRAARSGWGRRPVRRVAGKRPA